MEPSAPKTTPAASPPRRGVLNLLIRPGVYLFLAFTGLAVFATLLSPAGILLQAVFSTFAAGAVANLLALRIWERYPLAAIGLYWNSASAKHIVMGLGGGFGAAALILGVPLALGAARLEPAPDAPAAWGTFVFVSVVMLFGVVGEEILFRGYAFQVLVPAIGEWATILPMAALFGLAHSNNLGVTPIALANTTVWGVVLGYAVIRSRDLWLAIGLHFGWNWALPIFGVQVSGFRMGVTGYALQWNLPEIWTGGAYGPEGGLFCSGVAVLLIVGLKWTPFVRQELPLMSNRRMEAES